MASLAGQVYNRVLKSAAPSAAVVARAGLAAACPWSHRVSTKLPSARRFGRPRPSPSPSSTAKFTATGDKNVGGGQTVHTMWAGWRGRSAKPLSWPSTTWSVAPAGDEISVLDAEGSCLLLDECSNTERAVRWGSRVHAPAAGGTASRAHHGGRSTTNAVMVYSCSGVARHGNALRAGSSDQPHRPGPQPVTGDVSWPWSDGGSKPIRRRGGQPSRHQYSDGWVGAGEGRDALGQAGRRRTPCSLRTAGGLSVPSGVIDIMNSR